MCSEPTQIERGLVMDGEIVGRYCHLRPTGEAWSQT